MDEQLPAEAVLIRQRREEAGLSRYQVARRCGRRVSEPTIRRYETVPGIRRSAEVLARIASALAITPAGLENAGRPDAAAELRYITAAAAAQPDVAEVTGAPGVDESYQALMAEILAGLVSIERQRGLSAVQRRDLRAEFLSGLRREAGEFQRHLRLFRGVGDASAGNGGD